MNKLLVTIALLSLGTNAGAQTTTAKVQDVRTAVLPDPNPGSHRDRDAVMYRAATSDGDRYVLYYYLAEGGKMAHHLAVVDGKVDYDKATCIWKKDTVAVHLFNTTNQKALWFKAVPDGSSSKLYQVREQ